MIKPQAHTAPLLYAGLFQAQVKLKTDCPPWARVEDFFVVVDLASQSHVYTNLVARQELRC